MLLNDNQLLSPDVCPVFGSSPLCPALHYPGSSPCTAHPCVHLGLLHNQSMHTLTASDSYMPCGKCFPKHCLWSLTHSCQLAALLCWCEAQLSQSLFWNQLLGLQAWLAMGHSASCSQAHVLSSPTWGSPASTVGSLCHWNAPTRAEELSDLQVRLEVMAPSFRSSR